MAALLPPARHPLVGETQFQAKRLGTLEMRELFLTAYSIPCSSSSSRSMNDVIIATAAAKRGELDSHAVAGGKTQFCFIFLKREAAAVAMV